MALAKERRRKTRVPLQRNATITIGDRTIVTSIVDIAADGMSISSPIAADKGCELQVEFSLPDCSGLFVSAAVLVRIQKKGGAFLWGLRFKNPEGWVIRHVEEYVRQQLILKARRRRNDMDKTSDRPAAEPPPPAEGARSSESRTIDLDSAEKQREVARLFQEALKKAKR